MEVPGPRAFGREPGPEPCVLRWMTLRTIVLAAALATSACTSVPAPSPCALPEADRVWVDRALEAWRFTSREIMGIGPVAGAQTVFFSADCVLRSVNALSSPSAQAVTWTAGPHRGSVALPDGSEIPVGVTSFAEGEPGARDFVMATPGVWQARWYTGGDAYFAEVEDLWLTFEGAGQWTGYQWMIHPRGGAQTPAELLARYTKGRRWSQTEGFAVVMALDRIAGPGWKRHAFGDGARMVLEMLDDALDPR